MKPHNHYALVAIVCLGCSTGTSYGETDTGATAGAAAHTGGTGPGTGGQSSVGAGGTADQGATGGAPPANCSDARAKTTEQITVDQFGWLTNAPKVAILANPIKGQNSANTYVPGSTFQVRSDCELEVVFTGQVVPASGGKLADGYGDYVWDADFTALTTPGRYHIYDPTNDVQSFPFDVRDDVYKDVLKTALRMYYYQRQGIAIEARHGGNWSHGAAWLKADQDPAAVNWVTKSGPKDVRGGWSDAGDPNKYVPFTSKTLNDLLYAYEYSPAAFGDDWNIPESGNGVPDVLDEIKWELDWMLRMQMPNGSVATRVASERGGCDRADDPGTFSERRYYTQPSTWATSSFIVGCAKAAASFRKFESVYPGYADALLDASRKAWAYLAATPNKTPADGFDNGGERLSCGAQADENDSDPMLRIWAAAELYRATGEADFKSYFDSRYSSIKPTIWDPVGGQMRDSGYQAAHVAYALTPGADAAKVTDLKNALKNATNEWANMANGHPYKSHIWGYWWGSNHSKATIGTAFLFALRLGANPSDEARIERTAADYLHYIHGRNALSYVYLSNMGAKGAKLGASKYPMELFHYWFGDGSTLYDNAESKFGPPPGYLAGGPNSYYWMQEYRPPYGEPVGKAFLDGNGTERGNKLGNSWEITEPAIYYQAAYVHLLAYFVAR